MILDLRTQINTDICRIVHEFIRHDWINVNDDIIEKKR